MRVFVCVCLCVLVRSRVGVCVGVWDGGTLCMRASTRSGAYGCAWTARHATGWSGRARRLAPKQTTAAAAVAGFRTFATIHSCRLFSRVPYIICPRTQRTRRRRFGSIAARPPACGLASSVSTQRCSNGYSRYYRVLYGAPVPTASAAPACRSAARAPRAAAPSRTSARRCRTRESRPARARPVPTAADVHGVSPILGADVGDEPSPMQMRPGPLLSQMQPRHQERARIEALVRRIS